MDPYIGVPGRRDPAKGPLSPGSEEGGKAIAWLGRVGGNGSNEKGF